MKYVYFLAIVFFGCTTEAEYAKGIDVDFSNVKGDFSSFTKYANSSVREAPPPEVARLYRRDMNKPEIVRCWLMLDNMWDYRSDEYNFNFKIGEYIFQDDPDKFVYNWDRVVESQRYYEEYLTSFCNNSKEVLLVINRYHKEVVDGVISISKWKEVVKNAIIHYLSICPNLAYIEILNETAIDHFGGLTMDQYYNFYKKGYEVVNEINQELGLSKPLKVGGPTSTGVGLNYSSINTGSDTRDSNKLYKLYIFLKNYKWDTNPNKRLDFISFHEYHVGDLAPKALLKYESIIESLISDLELELDVPIFIDEAGLNPPESSLKHATGILTMHKYLHESPNIKLFPWVIYHTDYQRNYVMYTGQLNKTSFGMIGQMSNFHKSKEVFSESREINVQGFGIHVFATKDANGYCIQLWNNTNHYRAFDLTVTGIEVGNSEGITFDEYRVNADTTYKDMPDPEQIQFINSDSEFLMKELHLKPYSTLFLSIDS